MKTMSWRTTNKEYVSMRSKRIRNVSPDITNPSQPLSAYTKMWPRDARKRLGSSDSPERDAGRLIVHVLRMRRRASSLLVLEELLLAELLLCLLGL